MSNRTIHALPILFIFPILLASCNLPNSDQPAVPSQDDLNLTAAAATVAAASQPAATDISAPTQAASPTTSAPSQSETPGLKDAATFGGDVTIPDYTPIEAGQTFTKTWRLQNSGQSTWTTGYTLIFDEGDHMDGPDSVPLPQEVPPGELVDISVDLVAPEDPGTYAGYWTLNNAAEQPFEVDEDSEFSVFVIIRVVAEGTDTEEETPLEDGVSITGATLNASNTNYSGACPVDLTFTGAITSSGTGSLVYALVPTAQTPGFVWNLPGSFTVNYNAVGSHTLDIFFNLTISSSVTGSAYVQVTGSNIRTSNTVNFDITCDD